MSGGTPTPWFAVKGRYHVNIMTKPKGGYEHRVAECMWWTAPAPGQPDEATCAANAAFIVLACNSHRELIEALEAIRDIPTKEWSIDTAHSIARAALAKAKGEAF